MARISSTSLTEGSHLSTSSQKVDSMQQKRESTKNHLSAAKLNMFLQLYKEFSVIVKHYTEECENRC